MPRIFLNSSFKSLQPSQLPSVLETVFNQLEDQLNANPNVVSINGDSAAIPQGIESGDIVAHLTSGGLQVGVFDGSQVNYLQLGNLPGIISDAQHGNRAGGALHPNATVSISGFLSGADKIKLDHFKGDTSSTAPASTTEYPTSGDYGFHTDIVGVTYSLAKNKGGTIYLVPLT